MTRHRRSRHGAARWLATVVSVFGLLAFSLLAAGTRSGWTSGALANAANTAATGAVQFTHTYASGSSCSGGPAATSIACPGTLAAGSVPATGSLAATDSITNNGTVASARLSQSVAATSCEPVQFANSKNATNPNPLVDRFGTTFNPTAGPFSGAGSTVFDGSAGYATSVVAQTQPPTGLLSTGTFSGIGIWFRAASGTAGPLYSFGASASNGTGNVDRILYLNPAGQLTFVWNTGGTSIGPTTKSYADGQWHFAYVTIGGINVIALGLLPQVTLYVDGGQVVSTPLISLSPLSSYSGYWHMGYAPTSTTKLSTAYFGGSLSNFVVFDGPLFPSATTNPNSSTAFATFAANATEWWPLSDTGTTTYAGTLPAVGAGNGATASAACKSVDLGWSFTAPPGTATSATTSLYSLVTTGASSVGAPGPGVVQGATLSLSRDSTYNSYVAGLHLFVPMTSTISTLPGNEWPLTFSWTPSATTTLIS